MSGFHHLVLEKRAVASSSSQEKDPKVRGIDSITAQQLECLMWVQQGKSARDIGCILGISARIVEKHLIKIGGHLGVKTRVQAVVRARELGLIGRATL